MQNVKLNTVYQRYFEIRKLGKYDTWIIWNKIQQTRALQL